MPRPDLPAQSVTRAELDQRSREARLRLEHVERLLVVRPVTQQSLLRRFLRRLGSRICLGRQIGGRSTHPSLSRGRAPSGRVPGETGGAMGGFSAAPPAAWPSCPKDGGMSPVRSGPAVPRAFEAWNYWCGRGDLNSHVPSA
jgi:hypothetical protein